MKRSLLAFWVDDSGQDLAEYGLLIALIALIVIVALTPVGNKIAGMFNLIESHIP